VIPERDEEPKGLGADPAVLVEVHRHVWTFAHFQHLLRRLGERGCRLRLPPGLLPEAPREDGVDDRHEKASHARQCSDEGVMGFDPGQHRVHSRKQDRTMSNHHVGATAVLTGYGQWS
jgi:hypothetical protein